MFSEQKKGLSHSTRQREESVLVRKELLKIARSGQRAHEKTRGKIVDANQEMISTVSSKIEELKLNRSKASTMPTTSDRQICFIGPYRDSILLLLFLMKDLVEQATSNILNDPTRKFSPQLLFWLRSDFNNLVASATQEAAAFSRGSTTTSFDQWIYSTRLPNLHVSPVFHKVLTRNRYRETKDERHVQSDKRIRQRKPRLRYEILTFNLPVGKLRLVVPHNLDVHNTSFEVYDAFLSFVPSLDVFSHSLNARFTKCTSIGLEPRFHTQLNAFRQVQDVSIHEQLLAKGTIEEIDAAFRKGIVSPYDQYDGSNVWLSVSFLRKSAFPLFQGNLHHTGCGFLCSPRSNKIS